MTDPRTVTKGEPLRAEDWNAIVAAIRSATLAAVGPGLSLTRTADGVTIGLDLAEDRYAVPAVITAAPEGDDIPIEDAIYSARIMGTTAEVTDAVPRYGRLFADGVRVRPARVGDYCRVVRMPVTEDGRSTFTADLWILNEPVLTRRCAPTGGSGGTTPPGGGGEIPPLPPPPPSPSTPPASTPVGGGEA